LGETAAETAGFVKAFTPTMFDVALTAPDAYVVDRAMRLASHPAAEFLPKDRDAVEDVQPLNPLI